MPFPGGGASRLPYAKASWHAVYCICRCGIMRGLSLSLSCDILPSPAIVAVQIKTNEREESNPLRC